MWKLITWIKRGLLLNFFVFFILAPYSRKVTKICFCVGIALWIVLNLLHHKKKIYRKLIPHTFLNIPLALFLGAGVCSVFFSLNPYHSQSVFFERYLPYMLLFWIAVSLINNRSYSDKKKMDVGLYILIYSLIISGLIMCAGAIWDYVHNPVRRIWTVFIP